MAESAPPTQQRLVTALLRWGGASPLPRITQFSADDIADWINRFDLAVAIMPGVRPAMTFEAAFIAIFGETLDGKPVAKRKGAA